MLVNTPFIKIPIISICPSILITLDSLFIFLWFTVINNWHNALEHQTQTNGLDAVIYTSLHPLKNTPMLDGSVLLDSYKLINIDYGESSRSTTC